MRLGHPGNTGKMEKKRTDGRSPGFLSVYHLWVRGRMAAYAVCWQMLHRKCRERVSIPNLFLRTNIGGGSSVVSLLLNLEIGLFPFGLHSKIL